MRLHRILACLALLAVVLAGCADGGGDDAATDVADGGDESVAEARAGGGAPVDDADVASGAGASGAPASGSLTQAPEVDLDAVPIAAVERKIIYTGTTNADVEDIGVAVRAARDAATVEGGYVFAQDLAAREGRVVLKVPVDRFDAVFDAIVGIGEIVDQQIDAEDVTERFVDLESRQATLATSIDRIRGFLAETTNVDEISRLESELTRREAEHDVIAGQLRVLRDRTTYGTITAHFRLAEDAVATTVEEESGPPGFGEGLDTGWDAVTTAAAAAATAAGFVLPFAPLLALVALAWWWRGRRVNPAA
ncbi:MAG TPA: DUF4349 domain-containing protein [Acidimicrobiales bacterium]|nr:DUF4349 domain-containing protein [Acidimicrobiales bacterium]